MTGHSTESGPWEKGEFEEEWKRYCNIKNIWGNIARNVKFLDKTPPFSVSLNGGGSTHCSDGLRIISPVKPLSDEHDEEEQVAEEADKDEQAVEHQDGRQARRVPDV